MAVETTTSTELDALGAAACGSTELDEAEEPEPLLTSKTKPCLRTARGLGTRYRL